MRLSNLLPLALALALSAQIPSAQNPRPATDPNEEVRLPNGKLQKDEIVKAEFQKSLEDARELSKLADQLKADLEKNDRYVMSLKTLKQLDEIERLAKTVRGRLKKY